MNIYQHLAILPKQTKPRAYQEREKFSRRSFTPNLKQELERYEQEGEAKITLRKLMECGFVPPDRYLDNSEESNEVILTRLRQSINTTNSTLKWRLVESPETNVYLFRMKEAEEMKFEKRVGEKLRKMTQRVFSMNELRILGFDDTTNVSDVEMMRRKFEGSNLGVLAMGDRFLVYKVNKNLFFYERVRDMMVGARVIVLTLQDLILNGFRLEEDSSIETHLRKNLDGYEVISQGDVFEIRRQ